MRLGGAIKNVVVERIQQAITQRQDEGTILHKYQLWNVNTSVDDTNYVDYVVPSGKIWLVRFCRVGWFMRAGSGTPNYIEMVVSVITGGNTYNIIEDRYPQSQTQVYRLIQAAQPFILDEGETLRVMYYVSTAVNVLPSMEFYANISEYDKTV